MRLFPATDVVNELLVRFERDNECRCYLGHPKNLTAIHQLEVIRLHRSPRSYWRCKRILSVGFVWTCHGRVPPTAQAAAKKVWWFCLYHQMFCPIASDVFACTVWWCGTAAAGGDVEGTSPHDGRAGGASARRHCTDGMTKCHGRRVWYLFCKRLLVNDKSQNDIDYAKR